MAPPSDVTSEEQLKTLVKESGKLVVRCFFSAGGDDDVQQRHHQAEEGKAFDDIADSLDSTTVLCRIDLSSNPDVAPALPRVTDAVEGQAPTGDEQVTVDDEAPSSSACWVFFLQGQMVYTAQSSSTPWPKVSRLIALLDRNPDTLRQLARQEEVSRRQKLLQKGRRKEKAQDRSTAASAGVGGDARRGETGQEEADGEGAEEEGENVDAVLIFVAGDRSQVGKSSTCLGLLGALLKHGLRASDLAYIKPATQCERPQLVTEWCETNGVACRGIGPVVFYKGFTREFLRGGAGTSGDLLEEIRYAVRDISLGKKVVVVDGVGYPAVGSICGVSNGDVAAALGAPVLLVGKSGVGDAVDSYNLNACFFEARGVRVLGGVFNRISLDGYYSLERCREAVTSYFAQANPDAMPYGFVPEIASLKKPPGADIPTKQKLPEKVENVATPASPTSREGVHEEAETMAPEGVDARKRGGHEGDAVHSDASDDRDTDNGPGVETAAQLECLPVTAVESEEELEAFVDQAGGDRLVLLDFGAEWCKNCKAILPFVHRLPEEFHGGVAVATVDVDEASDLADARDVTAIPYFILLKDGAQVDTFAGSTDDELLEKVRQHLPTSQAEAANEDSTPSAGDSLDDTGKGDRSAAIEQSREGGKAVHAGNASSKNVDSGSDGGPKSSSDSLTAAQALIDAFYDDVDVTRLLLDIRRHAHDRSGGVNADAARADQADKSSLTEDTRTRAPPNPAEAEGARGNGFDPDEGSGGGSIPESGAGLQKNPGTDSKPRLQQQQQRQRKTRGEVEAEASKEGAPAG